MPFLAIQPVCPLSSEPWHLEAFPCTQLHCSWLRFSFPDHSGESCDALSHVCQQATDGVLNIIIIIIILKTKDLNPL